MNARSRTKISILNAGSAIFLTLINGLLGIITTKLVISKFGSDFNGLNSTANQIINVLLILEAGFALASNVALFAPVGSGDYATINGILNATRNKFRRIGVAFFSIGLIIATIYAVVVKTNLQREFVFTVIFMAVIPQALNLFLAITYRVLLQAQQKEFIINTISAMTIGAGHITNIITISNGGKMWMVRFVTMIFGVLNSFLIVAYTRKKNKFIDSKIKPTPELIKGTKDVMAQKVTNVVYSSWPIVFLSISNNGGTMLASVYAVYNSVFIMIKALLQAIIDAPRLGFGQMLANKTKEEIWPVFKQYEFIAVFFTYLAMGTTAAVILPFIKVYTYGVTDINYYDIRIAVFMIIISAFEMLHIPSGHMINMSGSFKVSRNIQIIACSVLLIAMFILGNMYGVYGMLLSLLIVAFLLASMEIIYVHSRLFSNKIYEFIKLVLPFMVFGTIVVYFEINNHYAINTYFQLIIYAFIHIFLNFGIGALICLILYRTLLSSIIKRIKFFKK